MFTYNSFLSVYCFGNVDGRRSDGRMLSCGCFGRVPGWTRRVNNGKMRCRRSGRVNSMTERVDVQDVDVRSEW